MTGYTATITLDAKFTDQIGDHLATALADYHVVAARGAVGRTDVTISYPAETLRQATATAVALAESASNRHAVAVQVQTSHDFDRQLGLEPIPELLSVSEAAAALGVSRQAVLKRIDAGTLGATKVGDQWVILQAALQKHV